MGSSQTKHARGTSPSGGCSAFPLDGSRTCLTQGWHRTWPHALTMMGDDELVRTLRHRGQVLRLSLVVSSTTSLNWSVTSFCMDRAWGLSSDEAGHTGADFAFLTSCGSLLSLTSGVREGDQNEGSDGLAAYVGVQWGVSERVLR